VAGRQPGASRTQVRHKRRGRRCSHPPRRARRGT
jgi:hypothetical protein